MFSDMNANISESTLAVHTLQPLMHNSLWAISKASWIPDVELLKYFSK